MIKSKYNIDDKCFSCNKTQVILGFIFAFIAVMLLTVGIVRIWTWFNVNFAHREIAYQKSRLKAGKPQVYEDTEISPGWMFEQYPDSRTKQQYMEWVKKQTIIDISGEDIGEDTGDPTKRYKPVNLTEEWVFEGIVGEGVTLFDTGIMTREEMEKQCQEECIEDEDCIASHLGETVFNQNCPCFVKCLCLLEVAPQADFERAQADRLDQQAAGLHNNAESMRDQADRCDQPWDACWWGTWGATSDQLDSAAHDMDVMANGMEAEAVTMRAKAAEMEACCVYETHELQDACANASAAEGRCDSYCTMECGQQCNYFSGKDGYYSSCQSTCDSHCNNICNEAIGSTCQDFIDNLTSVITRYIGDLWLEREKVQSGIETLEEKVTMCESLAQNYCIQQHGQGSQAYQDCYSVQSADCCNSVCCTEAGNTIDCCYSFNRLDEDLAEQLRTSCTDTCNISCTSEDANGNPVFNADCFGECFSGCYNEEALQACCYRIQPFEPGSCMYNIVVMMEAINCSCVAYARDCYEPADFCDEDCYGQTNCPRCGLQVVKDRLVERINEIDAEITDLTSRREDLGACCTSLNPTLEDQMRCFKYVMTRE